MTFNSTLGRIETGGRNATAVLAQSVGGGGTGGYATSRSVSPAVSAASSLGGSGGKGGQGGAVRISNNSAIRTSGEAAIGLQASSIGGGGGTGGGAAAFAVALPAVTPSGQPLPSIALTNAIGGSGGDGGKGAAAAVDNRNAGIETFGVGATGILLQSIGGGGGYGGAVNASASSGLSFDKTLNGLVEKLPLADSVTVVNAIGGNGGNGGDGGSVSASLTASSLIRTLGPQADGVLAQSVGGGGGMGGGGSAVSGGTLALRLAMGGKGGAGGSGGMVSVSGAGTIETHGDASHGIFVQSIGGGGGDGGAGNRGGIIDVANTGSILTTGQLSHGIMAQSIGGGGGQGGVAYASGTNKTNLSATLGGAGGTGNIGGDVSVRNTGTIQTRGQESFGLFAQSVGGGGGTGVGALSSDNKNLVLNFTAGGAGGSGANGGGVSVRNEGTIRTQGEEAHAIVAQSIGGGGGAFMMSVPEDKTASAGTDEKAVPAGTMKELLKAVGIEKVPAASTAGSGKKPSAKSGSLTLGGSGGVSGSGGAVNVVHGGSITTSGLAAFGILAQSVGGGGFASAAGSPGGVKYAASYGGKGGASGDGGTVNIGFNGNASIQTSGDYAAAVFAQSIGGGGGYGGASVLQGWTLPVLGGAGGSSGQGGYIEVRTLTGSTTIRTTGAKAHGVFAQSLGGGGGTVSDALKTDDTARAALEKTATVLAGLIGKAGGSGTVLDNIDKVPEDLQGIVRLFGNDKDTVESALAALRKSLNERSASQGAGGDISIKLAGDIRTSGAGSYGIFAQSGFQQSSGALDASRAGGSIAVDYSGTLQGGSGEGAGIVIDGGRNNTIVIGAGSRVGALSDRAIVSTFGQESVRNFGTVVGDIDLARGNTTEWNEFRNEVGGTYVSGGSGTIKVGNGNGWFYNAGTFDVGGMGRIATATVQKVDLQLGGTLLVDVNSVAAGGPKADLVQASRVLVEGVKIKPHAVEGLLPGRFTVVSASSLQASRAATAAGGPGSPIAWSASQSGGDISISPSADFVGKAQGNLTDTDRSLLDSLQRAWDGNEAGMAGIFASMANIESAQQYETAIGSMTPTEDLGQLASDQTLAGRKSLNAALSCPVFDGAGVTLRETQCVWSRITGSRTTQDRGSASDGYSQDGLSYRIGGQWEIRPDWFFGATAAYNVSSMHTRDSLTSVHGRSGDVSVSLKHQTGPWLLAGALHAGYGDYDSSSLFWVGDDLWSAENKNDVWTAGLRLRAAYELASDDWYLRPYADLDVLHTYMPGYTLAGDGATLQAGAMKEWSVAVSPTLEAGTRVDLGRYGWLRPYVSVGATFINNRSLDSDVSFSDGTGKGITFTSSSSLPERLFNVGAGVQLYAQDKYELRAEYRAQLASEFRNQELSLRVAMRF